MLISSLYFNEHFCFIGMDEDVFFIGMDEDGLFYYRDAAIRLYVIFFDDVAITSRSATVLGFDITSH